MADQGKWWKLWCSADDDPDLSELSLEDFGRWCKLGMYLAQHGTNGSAVFRRTGRILQEKFRVQSQKEVMEVLASFPNCDFREEKHPNVSHETVLFVSFSNWRKYQEQDQGDTSTVRVRKHRFMKRFNETNVTVSKKGVPLKKEIPPHTPLLEKNNPSPKEIPPLFPREKSTAAPARLKREIGEWFQTAFWPAYPRKEEKPRALNAMLKLKPDAELRERLLARLQVWKIGSEKWRKGFVHLASNWVKDRLFEEEPVGTNRGANQETPGQVRSGGTDYGAAFRERTAKV